MIIAAVEDVQSDGSVIFFDLGEDEINAKEIEEQLVAQQLLYTEGW